MSAAHPERRRGARPARAHATGIDATVIGIIFHRGPKILSEKRLQKVEIKSLSSEPDGK